MTSTPGTPQGRPASPLPSPSTGPRASPAWTAGIRSSSPLRPWPNASTKVGLGRPWPLLHSLSLPSPTPRTPSRRTSNPVSPSLSPLYRPLPLRSSPRSIPSSPLIPASPLSLPPALPIAPIPPLSIPPTPPPAPPTMPPPPKPLALRAGTYAGPTGRSAALNGVLSASATLVILAVLPLSTIRYALTRPRGFTLKRYLILRFLRLLSLLVPVLPPPETRALRWAPPKTLGRRADGVKVDAVAVAPAPAEWRTAYAADVPGVEPLEMPGYVLTPSGIASGPARADEKIVLYIHGGGYVRGHPLWTAFPFRLAAETGRRVYCAQYRKTLDAGTAFPGPLLDALAAWQYVTSDMEFKPSQIVLSGDSAGAHLSLMLVRQLHALGEGLPGGLALASPWVDFTCSFPSWDAHSLDYLTKTKLQKAIASATRHYADAEKGGAFFSPALAEAGHWEFLADTPVFVSCGGVEAFTDEDEALVAGMRRDGVAVTLWKDDHGVHDTPILDVVLPAPSKPFAHFKDGVLDLLRIEAASDAEIMGAAEEGDGLGLSMGSVDSVGDSVGESASAESAQLPLSPASENSGVFVDVEQEQEREGEVEDHPEEHEHSEGEGKEKGGEEKEQEEVEVKQHEEKEKEKEGEVE